MKTVDVLGSSDKQTKAGAGIDTMYFVVNYDEGFAILGADTRLWPVYAICDEGTFVLADSAAHPGIKMAIAGLDKQADQLNGVGSTRVGQLPGFNDYEWSVLVGEQVLNEKYGPFGRHRKWGQGTPFNKYCFTPSGQQSFAGCVAVATALIMAHYQHPNSILGHDLHWSEMDNVRIMEGSPVGVESIVRLMASLGTSQYLQMQYSVSSGSANTKQRVPPTLQALGYNCGSNTNWTFEWIPDFDADNSEKQPKLNLINNHYRSGNTGPVLMRGNTAVHQGSAGHAWIIDGYMNITMRIRTHGMYPENRDYYYCNWGWNGAANGWYVSDSFMTELRGPNKGELDEVHSTASYDFTTNREMLIGIKKN